MKNHPIAYTPVIHYVMLRNGRMVPAEGQPPVRPARSKKEARARRKTARLTARRLIRHGEFPL